MHDPSDVPDLPLVAPPWRLDASGFALLVREARGFGTAVFADYARSPVGPYRELLYIPAVQRCLAGKSVSISRIYVSTHASAINGQMHWAIPKQLADFEVRPTRKGVRVVVHGDAGEVLAMQLRWTWWTLPFTSHALPSAMRTLTQASGSSQLVTRPHARGLLQPARVTGLHVDAAQFPALAAGDVVAAFRLSRVRLLFPAPQALPGDPLASSPVQVVPL